MAKVKKAESVQEIKDKLAADRAAEKEAQALEENNEERKLEIAQVMGLPLDHPQVLEALKNEKPAKE